MHIIPVIDVMGGVAVAARGGARADYKPLVTPLAAGPAPIAVARGFLTLYPFRTLYVADLDGIRGRGANLDLIRSLSKALPGVALWVDNGASDETRVRDLLAIPDTAAVIGSESKLGPAELDTLTSLFGERLILSLDFKGDEFLGSPQLLSQRTAWPDRVIAMTLARVGSGEGPDVTRLGQIAAAAGMRRVYAAGGIRGSADLEAARAAGAAGALVATALHGGQIKTGDLEEIAG